LVVQRQHGWALELGQWLGSFVIAFTRDRIRDQDVASLRRQITPPIMAHYRPKSALIYFRLLIFENFSLFVLCKFFKLLVYLIILIIYVVIKSTKTIIRLQFCYDPSSLQPVYNLQSNL